MSPDKNFNSRHRPPNRRAPVHLAQEARAEANRQQALALRVAGLSLRAIAGRLGVHHSTVADYLRTALAEQRTASLDTAEELRAIETGRLETVLAEMMPLLTHTPEIRTEKEGRGGRPAVVLTVEAYQAKVRAAEVLIKVSARLSALFGLDAPTKQEVGAPGQFDTLETIRAKLAERQAIHAAGN